VYIRCTHIHCAHYRACSLTLFAISLSIVHVLVYSLHSYYSYYVLVFHCPSYMYSCIRCTHITRTMYLYLFLSPIRSPSCALVFLSFVALMMKTSVHTQSRVHDVWDLKVLVWCKKYPAVAGYLYVWGRFGPKLKRRKDLFQIKWLVFFLKLVSLIKRRYLCW
jgi:hypothetical protein